MMRAPKIESGSCAFSQLSASNEDLHEFLMAYLSQCENWGSTNLSAVGEAMDHVIREKPRLPLQTSHMSITKTIEHGLVCEKIRIVVTAPGGMGYLVVQLPPRDTVDKLDMNQVCNNINDVANRLSTKIWRSLTSHEQKVLLFTSIGGYSGSEPFWFVNDQMSIKEKRTLQEAMDAQDYDSPMVTPSHALEAEVDARKDFVSRINFTKLQDQVDYLDVKFRHLAKAFFANKERTPDLASRGTVLRDGSKMDDPWANAMLQTTQPHQERTYNQDGYLANPYLPPGKHGMCRVNSDVPISDSQSQMSAFLDHKMPGSWVPEPMAPSEVDDARDTKRKEKAKASKLNRQSAFERGDWSFSNDEATHSASGWETKSQDQEDTWSQDDTWGQKATRDQGNTFPTMMRHHHRTYDCPVVWDDSECW